METQVKDLSTLFKEYKDLGLKLEEARQISKSDIDEAKIELNAKHEEERGGNANGELARIATNLEKIRLQEEYKMRLANEHAKLVKERARKKQIRLTKKQN